MPRDHSQTVHPEGVLGGRVGQDHIWVIEHVQSIQGQGVNLEFVRGNWLSESEADITRPGQRGSSLERLGGDSPVTGVGGTHKRLSFALAPAPHSAPPQPLSMFRLHLEAHLSGLCC